MRGKKKTSESWKQPFAREKIQGEASENLAVVRHMSLNLLRQKQSSRVGIHAKPLKAGWDNHYLQRVLDGVN